MDIRNNSQILFGIVTYREDFWQSLSFQSLYNSYQAADPEHPVTVFVYDNTDIEDWHVTADLAEYRNCVVHYKHDPTNPGIAYAYNRIAEYAKKNDIPFIVFLDQDTSLPQDFYSTYIRTITENQHVMIAAPKIYTENGLLSPSGMRFYRSFRLNEIKSEHISLGNTSCINSGLLLNTRFFFQCSGYNESLRLDFCDHDFIRRAARETEVLTVIPICLKQDFSAETNTKQKALKRYELFVVDMKEFRKNKNKMIFFLTVDLPHLLRQSLRFKSWKFFSVRVNAAQKA